MTAPQRAPLRGHNRRAAAGPWAGLVGVDGAPPCPPSRPRARETGAGAGAAEPAPPAAWCCRPRPATRQEHCRW